MALSARLIRRRIKSVYSTRKITKAMELVAAAKMRRAVAAALKTRAYAKLAWGMIEALEGTAGAALHPLLQTSGTTYARNGRTQYGSNGTRTVLCVVMASDRGLCGGFNAALFREVFRDRNERPGGVHPFPQADVKPALTIGDRDAQFVFVAVGKQAEQFIRRQRWNLIASFTNLSVAPTVAELRPIAKLAMDAFTKGEVDEVRIAFTDFISSLRQQPRVRTLLPLQRIEEVGIGDERRGGVTSPLASDPVWSPLRQGVEFCFEPSPAIVLDAMLPRLVELQVYQCYLETGASEHSSRMLAMRNASDAAADMIDDLTLTFNQARQALITREIAEISAGRAALAT